MTSFHVPKRSIEAQSYDSILLQAGKKLCDGFMSI